MCECDFPRVKRCAWNICVQMLLQPKTQRSVKVVWIPYIRPSFVCDESIGWIVFTKQYAVCRTWMVKQKKNTQTNNIHNGHMLAHRKRVNGSSATLRFKHFANIWYPFGGNMHIVLGPNEYYILWLMPKVCVCVCV